MSSGSVRRLFQVMAARNSSGNLECSALESVTLALA